MKYIIACLLSLGLFSGSMAQDHSMGHHENNLKGSSSQLNEGDCPTSLSIEENEVLLNGVSSSAKDVKIKQEGEGVDYKYKKDEDGEVLKYEDQTEKFDYTKDEKGRTKYEYNKDTQNENLNVEKNKDGSGKIKYEGEFDNMNNAKVNPGTFNKKECL